MLYLYLHLFRLPCVPVWRFGDQAFYLLNAERMLRGEVLYRDLFQFNLPGTEYLYFLLIRRFGPALWLASASLLLAGTAVALLVYSLARRCLSGAVALVPPVAVVSILLRSNLDGSHHLYSTMLVLVAANLIAERTGGLRLCAAGAVLAAATLFTTNRGVFAVAGVCLFLLMELGPGLKYVKAVAALLISFSIVVGPSIAHLARAAGARVLFDSVVVFPWRYYSLDSSNRATVFWDLWHDVLPWRFQSLPMIFFWLVVYLGVPLTLAWFLFSRMPRHAANMGKSRESRTLVLCAVMGSALFLSVVQAPSGVRINCAAVFAFVLATAMLRAAIGDRLILGVLTLMLLFGASETVWEQLRWSGYVHGPRGAMVFFQPAEYEDFAWVAQRAKPGDELFGSADLDFTLGLTNPTPVPFVTTNGYTRPEQVRSVIAGLERSQARFVSWAIEADAECGPADNLPPLRRYLREHYTVVRQFADGTEILERSAGRAQSRTKIMGTADLKEALAPLKV